MNAMSLTKQGTSAECGAAIESFLSETEKSREVKGQAHALVIDGKSLTLALEGHSDRLLALCKRCAAVLCCRLTPLQKSLIVRLVKSDRSHPTTASVGDGANDVSMIQESDVGLGIMGREGRQAARYSDYAFARFSFLRKALLVHGHLFYHRIAILVQYFFYKNVAMITAQIYFTFFSAFSAQTLFSGYFLMFFNLFFTALPIMVFSLFEKHRPISQLMNDPTLYRGIRGNQMLSNWNFLRWNLLAIWHSLVFFFGALFAFQPGNSPFDNGLDYGLYDLGTVVMTVCVLTVNIKLILETYNFNGMTVGAFFISFAVYFVMTLVCSSLFWSFFSDTMDLHGSFQMMLGSAYVWFLIILLTFTALLPDIIIRTIHDTINFKHRLNVDDVNHNHVNTYLSDVPDQRHPIARTPVGAWTFNDDIIVDSFSSNSVQRTMMSPRRDFAGSVSSRSRLISTSSTEGGSPADSKVYLPLMASQRDSAPLSCESYTTSFSRSVSCSTRRLQFD